MPEWFESENIDAAEFVDNAEEIITKLRAIQKFRDSKINLEEFLLEVR
jgi:hypothetical protein